MDKTLISASIALLTAVLWTSLAPSQSTRTAAPPAEKLSYEPPTDAGPPMRIHSKPRGPQDTWPRLFILTPEHTGLTVQEQPSLFWYLSQPARAKMVLTVTKDGDVEPLVEVPLDSSKAGIQRLDLGGQKLKLQAGVLYQWTVALITDPAQRAKDIFCSAAIKRVEPTEVLIARLGARTGRLERGFVFARQGIWYDALTSISDQVEQTPNDKTVREQRASLLKQVGLPEAAEFDMGAVK